MRPRIRILVNAGDCSVVDGPWELREALSFLFLLSGFFPGSKHDIVLLVISEYWFPHQ